MDKLEDQNVETSDPNADSYLTKRSAEKDVTLTPKEKSGKEKRSALN